MAWVSDLFPVVREFADRPAGDLSGGQQQQLAIARALVAGPASCFSTSRPSAWLPAWWSRSSRRSRRSARGASRSCSSSSGRSSPWPSRTETHVMRERSSCRGARPGDADDVETDHGRLLRAMSWLQSIIDALSLGSSWRSWLWESALVFGVLRIINFAQGELITAGAYALLLTNDLPVAVSIVVLFRRRDRVLARDGVRIPAAAACDTGGGARRDVRRQLHAAEHRVARVRLAGRGDQLPAEAQSGGRDRRPPDPLGHDRDDRRRRAVAYGDGAVPLSHGSGLSMRAAAVDFRPRGCSACARGE